MSNNSDPLFERYADLDFSNAKPVSTVPTLVKLQAEHGGKSRITIRVDNATLSIFKARAEMTGSNYPRKSPSEKDADHDQPTAS